MQQTQCLFPSTRILLHILVTNKDVANGNKVEIVIKRYKNVRVLVNVHENLYKVILSREIVNCTEYLSENSFDGKQEETFVIILCRKFIKTLH